MTRSDACVGTTIRPSDAAASPDSWPQKKIRWATRVLRGASPRPIDDPKYFDDEGEFSWVRISDVTASGKYLHSTTQRLSPLGASLSIKRYPGQLILSIAGSVGKPCIAGIKCCIHDGFVYFPDLPDITSQFLYYVFSAGQVFRGLGKLGTQLNLNTDTVGDIKIAFPPLTVQRQIVDFLDRKTAAIDEVVRMKERMIELLSESTKAHMAAACLGSPVANDLGEQLRHLPSSWTVTRIAAVAKKITNGYVGPTRDILVENGTRYLQSLHIKDNSIRFDPPYFVDDAWSSQHFRSILQEDDVLIVQTGDIGQVAVVPKNFAGVNCHALIIITTDKQQMLGRYLSWILNSHFGQSWLHRIQTGALHPHLNCTFVRELPIPQPPLDEQARIADLCDGLAARFRRSAAAIERQVQVLREYGQALITAAVTGQLPVTAGPDLEAAVHA